MRFILKLLYVSFALIALFMLSLFGGPIGFAFWLAIVVIVNGIFSRSDKRQIEKDRHEELLQATRNR